MTDLDGASIHTRAATLGETIRAVAGGDQDAATDLGCIYSLHVNDDGSGC